MLTLVITILYHSQCAFTCVGIAGECREILKTGRKTGFRVQLEPKVQHIFPPTEMLSVLWALLAIFHDTWAILNGHTIQF